LSIHGHRKDRNAPLFGSAARIVGALCRSQQQAGVRVYQIKQNSSYLYAWFNGAAVPAIAAAKKLTIVASPWAAQSLRGHQDEYLPRPDPAPYSSPGGAKIHR